MKCFKTSNAVLFRIISFTLIELMIVVSIIVILMSILLPALKNARERTSSIACLGNLKQFGLAFTSYSDDNNNWLPQDPNDGKSTNRWDTQLMEFLNYSLNSGPEIYHCPSGKTNDNYITDGLWHSRGYDMNRYVGRAGESAASETDKYMRSGFLSRMPAPSRLGVIFDLWTNSDTQEEYKVQGPSSTSYYLLKVYASTNHYGYRHQLYKGLNCVFADGHVDWVQNSNPGSEEGYPEGIVLKYRDDGSCLSF